MKTARIETSEFTIDHDRTQHCVRFYGAVRLRTAGDYDELRALLRHAGELADHELRLDFRDLDSLSSSGTTVLGHFIVEARKADRASIAILGSAGRPWQARSLATLARIWNKAILTIHE